LGIKMVGLSNVGNGIVGCCCRAVGAGVGTGLISTADDGSVDGLTIDGTRVEDWLGEGVVGRSKIGARLGLIVGGRTGAVEGVDGVGVISMFFVGFAVGRKVGRLVGMPPPNDVQSDVSPS
jgi:hypothetical protein